MNTTSSPVSTTSLLPIQVATNIVNYYVPIIILVFGIVGSLCNFITFTAPQLRKSSCGFYFLIASIFELLSITFGLISRFATDYLGSTLNTTSTAYCKLRAYLVSAIPLVVTYLVLLSSIDRSMSSSVNAHYRSFSQIKMAYRATIVAILLGFISCLHILVFYDLRPRCATMPGVYAMFDSMFVVFWLGIIPHALMLIFGIGTIMNIRRKKRRITIVTDRRLSCVPVQQKRESKTDVQLIAMMLVQVGISSLLIMTRMISYAYYILKPTATGYARWADSFLMSFTISLYYTNFAKSFYVYTLASHLFRSVFIHRIKSCLRTILGRHTPLILQGNRRTTVETFQ